jgi:hypothetical protein
MYFIFVPGTLKVLLVLCNVGILWLIIVCTSHLNPCFCCSLIIIGLDLSSLSPLNQCKLPLRLVAETSSLCTGCYQILSCPALGQRVSYAGSVSEYCFYSLAGGCCARSN